MNGYGFNFIFNNPASWTYQALPANPAARSFYTDQTNIVRYSDNGMLAGANSPIVNF